MKNENSHGEKNRDNEAGICVLYGYRFGVHAVFHIYLDAVFKRDATNTERQICVSFFDNYSGLWNHKVYALGD